MNKALRSLLVSRNNSMIALGGRPTPEPKTKRSKRDPPGNAQKRHCWQLVILSLLVGQVVALAQPVAAAEPGTLFERAFEVFHGITNFSAGVDVQTIDRTNTNSSAVLAKETWKFAREGRVNRFTRNRYLPFRGREVIESTNYSGGYLTGVTNIALPAHSSLPGFEVCSFLVEMRERQVKDSRQENGLTVVESQLSDGITGLAWFSPLSPLPSRIEKRRGSDLVLVYTRSQTTTDKRLLPDQDVFHFYESREVKTTIIRSFTGIREQFTGTSTRQTNSESEGTNP